MFRYLMNDGNIRDFLISFLLSLPIFLLSLSFHETAHGYVASKLGDPTARSLGRLTLNPAKHLDPIGFLCMVLFGMGWAKPVPVDTRYFKKPRRDMAITAAAGPISNILMAAIFALILRLSYTGLQFVPIGTSTVATVISIWLSFLILCIRLNAMLAVFNLIPVSPLDGGRILNFFLPARLAYQMSRYERAISLVLMAALMIGVLTPLINFLSDLLVRLILTATLLKDTAFWQLF